MISLLYVGNNLKHSNSNITTIETLSRLLESEGFNLTLTSSKKSKVNRLVDMIITFFKVYKKVDYILIDTYSTSNFYYALVISQLSRLFKVKYIPILHGGNLPDRISKSKFLSKLIFKNAYKNVSPSLFLKERFHDDGFSNIVYIPNTIEVQNYNFEEKRNFQEINLLWVRSFANIYNPKMAVKVLQELLKLGYKTSLCMVGPDKDGSLIKTKAFANSIGVEITFTGKLSKKEWISISKDYNIFINTTNFDNMPVSVIEAMALGLPVVSTNVGGIPYLISHDENGLTLNPNDVSAMVNEIERLLNDVQLREQIVHAAKQKVDLFDWQVVKKQWIRLLND